MVRKKLEAMSEVELRELIDWYVSRCKYANYLLANLSSKES